MKIAFALLVALIAAPRPALAQFNPDRGSPVEGAPSPGLEDSSPGGLLLPDTDLIDLPSAAVLDLGGFANRSRFFSSGGFVDWLGFGVYPRVNLGVSFNVERLVGNDSPVQLTRPELQLKMRFFDGDRYIPAFAFGFDGQGWLYNRPDKRYNHKQRGVYFVGTQEIGIPGLQAHAGMNVSDFDSNSLFGMIGVSLNLRDKLKLMTEWDAINNVSDSRFNAGLRFYLTPYFNFDVAVRAIGHGGTFSNGQPREPERVVQFKYVGNF
ncbi:MAG: hypothetical protein AUJ52_13695 [Elusimicrobia bacterium CG1_02_63_36]|nr:MAG: hypothetical protein AUJ52_13695 [Elusimicrobia bacterium CG1_02_63_36]PIP82258.1 MAG: hypothetical protein COR54_15695 [Elusimicrobia bacterium CG22_combo_CG10-13_8_21_14_all_63_91]PJA15324.1 MAG: hypothetical protein COX66_10395 [Elusimicrobia bacterium CG_4_10_14_0_2_um_filter_63_34]PJB26991.1 MAG: hypothetical protein CO113_00805 [Elusimicrobia bacterium CG_4_9_14_3_um_filter_62_55]